MKMLKIEQCDGYYFTRRSSEAYYDGQSEWWPAKGWRIVGTDTRDGWFSTKEKALAYIEKENQQSTKRL